MKLAILSLFALCAFAQTTINAPAVQLDATGSAALIAWMSTQGTGTLTTITAPVAIGDTTISVDVAAGIAPNAVLSIGTEHLLVTARTGRVLTVTRGHNGSTPAAHEAGATVTELRFRTFNALGRQIIIDAMRQIVAQHAPLDAPVAAATAAKNAAVAGAVQ